VVRLETIETERRGEHLLGGRLYFSRGRALVEELLNKKGNQRNDEVKVKEVERNIGSDVESRR